MKALILMLCFIVAVVPVRYVAVLLPTLWTVQRLALEPHAVPFNIGPVPVSPVDFVVLILLAKFLFEMLCKRELVADRNLYAAIAIFLAVNLLATFAAGAKFGPSQFSRCLTSWVRLCLEIAVVPITAQAIKTLPQARRCLWILFATVGVLAAIQFINFFGASHGITIGEVQGIERGEVRYFGPVGDSVGFVLLLGYLAALCFGRLVLAGVFLGAIALTAGLGAIFAATVGTALFLLFSRHAPAFGASVRRSAWMLPALVLGGIVAGVFYARPAIGPLLDRLAAGRYESSGSQRLASASVAQAMILDNPMLGVGYLGYQTVLDRYGGAKVFNLEKLDGSTANANNQFLQALTDSGLSGFAAFILLIFCAARSLLKVAMHREEAFVSTLYLAAFLWLLSQVFGNLAAVWLIPSFGARLLWLLLGIGVAASRLLTESESREPAPAQSAASETQVSIA